MATENYGTPRLQARRHYGTADPTEELAVSGSNVLTRLHQRPVRLPNSDVQAVRSHLERVLHSPHFDGSTRSREFLRYVVEEVLAGRGAYLKQAAIAVEVFGRKADFDAVIDPIVRVQAGRLRRSLERYYLLSGDADSMRIELTKGSYAPVFVETSMPAQTSSTATAVPGMAHRRGIPLCHAARRRCHRRDFVARGADRGTVPPRHRARRKAARSGHLGQSTGPLRVAWFRAGQRRLAGVRLPAGGLRHGPADLGRRVSHRAARRTAGRAMPRTSAASLRHASAPSTAPSRACWPANMPRADFHRGDNFSAIARCQHFMFSHQVGALLPAIESLQQLTSRAPEIELGWTSLARLYLMNHSFELSSMFTPVEIAIGCANQSVLLEPASARTRCLMAKALLIKGELAAARREVDHALRLNSDSLAHREEIGWLMALTGDWDAGVALMRDALARNPYCQPCVSHGLWADAMRRRDFDAAYAAALEYRDPNFFWRELMIASSLGQLGRLEEAGASGLELMRARPQFHHRGRRLIGALHQVRRAARASSSRDCTRPGVAVA